MDSPRIVSLCAGIGGLDLGVTRATGGHVVACCERDPYAASVLLERMEEKALDPAPVWVGDIRDFHYRNFSPLPVDGIIAGIPCQPWSIAGKRQGQADERHLGHELVRIVGEVGPRWVFVENVPGFIAWDGIGGLLGALSEIGFDAEWTTVSAAEVGAPHRRERVFILAHAAGGGAPTEELCGRGDLSQRGGEVADPNQERRGGGPGELREGRGPKSADSGGSVGNANCAGLEGKIDTESLAPQSGWWTIEPDVGRVASRFPVGMDGVVDEENPGTEEVLRALRESNGAASVQWAPGGLGRVQTEDVLRAQLCEHEGPPVPLGNVSLACAEAPRTIMRGVWFDGKAACTPCRRNALEQLSREYPDSVRLVPQLLACDCGAARVDTIGTHARSRVDRLRCLGNACVPSQAEHAFRILWERLES